MEIKAFKAFRFNSAVVGDAADCICPPYDVIDEKMQDELYKKSQYNAVRIVKGKSAGSDTDTDNKYTRAGVNLAGWIEKGALIQDGKDTIYAYVQDFEIGPMQCTRSGFVALGKLKPFGQGVQPHEKTLDGPKADRLKLMRQKKAQFGQIFLLFDDPEKIADEIIEKVATGDCLIDFTDDDGVKHKIYAIDDPADVDAVTSMMASKEAVIADGHHRYETALNYFAETKNSAAEYRMMTFVNMHNEGLVVLPTHRLVAGLADFDIASMIEKIADEFEVAEYSFTDDAEKESAKKKMFARMRSDFQQDKNSFGIYAAGGKFYVSVLKDSGSMNRIGPDMSDAAKGLDVNVLHLLVLDKVMGIGDKELAGQSNIKYIKDIGDAIDQSIAKVDSGKSQVVFFMNPTRIDQVRDIAAANEKMPQKSTFFYPKIYTGLVINKL
ncbi:MAG: DUF1015 domain-containing protein [Planctomycetes bacterium]|nr:DUF1015 domain-containing protein [Planctomycetota bacterium]